MSRDLGEKRLITGAVFLDVAKTLSIVWVDGLLYKLTVLNIPSYLVKIIFSFLYDAMFEASFQSVIRTRRGMRVDVDQVGIVFSHSLLSVCQRRAYAISPRRVGSIRR